MTHLIQSISIRCCSARLFSLFTFLCSAAKIILLSSKALPQAFFNTLNSSFGMPVVMSVLAKAPGFVIEKYSSSSLSTMMACFDNRGFCDVSEVGSPGDEGIVDCAWNRPGELAVP
jgi:hypothetical protein